VIQAKHFNSHFLPATRIRKPYSNFIVLVLHGKGDSLKPFKNFQEELGMPHLNFLLLNAPKKFMGGYSWYGDPPYQREGVLRIREKIFDEIRALEAQGWPTRNIFLLGFSQGCLVSADVALHYPAPLGGLVGVSGYFNFVPRWKNFISPKAKSVPWLLTHGRRDDVLPVEDTKFGVKKLRGLGLKIDWTESEKKHVFASEDYPAIKRWLVRRCNELALNN
jgi:phospholipase/carboxylesterase